MIDLEQSSKHIYFKNASEKIELHFLHTYWNNSATLTNAL